MTTSIRKWTASTALGLAMLAPGLHAQQGTPVKHHSMLKGALVGAAAGHVMGGHAKAGALAGALVQHHRNKKHAIVK